MAGIAGCKLAGRLSLKLRSFGNLQTCHTCHYLPSVVTYLPGYVTSFLPQPAIPAIPWSRTHKKKSEIVRDTMQQRKYKGMLYEGTARYVI